MDKKKLLKLADYIEASDDFNIENHRTCFCGLAERGGTSILAMIEGVDGAVFESLVMPEGWSYPNPAYAKPQAVRTLRHFAETGAVDWTIGAAK